MKTALIIQGGWVGHEPQILAEFFATRLEAEGFTVSISNTLSTLNDLDGLRAYDLISLAGRWGL
jgi:type 1 glutamine amidotransferase